MDTFIQNNFKPLRASIKHPHTVYSMSPLRWKCSKRQSVCRVCARLARGSGTWRKWLKCQINFPSIKLTSPVLDHGGAGNLKDQRRGKSEQLLRNAEGQGPVSVKKKEVKLAVKMHPEHGEEGLCRLIFTTRGERIVKNLFHRKQLKSIRAEGGIFFSQNKMVVKHVLQLFWGQ